MWVNYFLRVWFVAKEIKRLSTLVSRTSTVYQSLHKMLVRILIIFSSLVLWMVIYMVYFNDLCETNSLNICPLMPEAFLTRLVIAPLYPGLPRSWLVRLVSKSLSVSFWYNKKTAATLWLQVIIFNSLTPVSALTSRDKRWRLTHWLLASSPLTKICIIYIQVLQEGNIFLVIPRSEWWA